MIEGLKTIGISAAQYSYGDKPTHLILSKRYDQATIDHAKNLQHFHGTRLILDLCDNHFYSEQSSADACARRSDLLNAIESVDIVISSSHYLADTIRTEVINTPKIVVIGDLTELPHEYSYLDIVKHPMSWALTKLLQFTWIRKGRSKNTRLIWFGNHGGSFLDGGMNDIARIRRELEHASDHTPITLTIVSNSFRKYKKIATTLNIPTFYIPWNQAFFSYILRLHTISIIPIKANPFTMAKSSNRVATSLIHGLTVIADPIPSYLEYSNSIYLGNWESNLHKVLMDRTASKPIPSKEEFLDKNASIIRSWAAVFSSNQ